ncbi:MAG: SGNH/GDSL hydrolase family protein [Aphanothece sp. CMT-3BRIN-NPC111]|jgi:hypothetical protein|nr:SGNH/GDSL hydrolase family protein [Aphanothece sp. CMT-3BRIN-NPC111]
MKTDIIYFNIILLLILLFISTRIGYIIRILSVIYTKIIGLPTDTLSSKNWWQSAVRSQVSITHDKEYEACVFGDSITAPIGNTLGEDTFNFAIDGMSSISLIEQLKILTAANVRYKKAVIAIGTNDACYCTTNDIFVKNMKQIIALVKEMGATNIMLIPAFYSTIAASHNPLLAGTIARVEEINELLRQVAEAENVLILGESVQPLFEGQALKENLTTDGVHLNTDGINIYRQALLKLLSSSL